MNEINSSHVSTLPQVLNLLKTTNRTVFKDCIYTKFRNKKDSINWPETVRNSLVGEIWWDKTDKCRESHIHILKCAQAKSIEKIRQIWRLINLSPGKKKKYKKDRRHPGAIVKITI